MTHFMKSSKTTSSHRAFIYCLCLFLSTVFISISAQASYSSGIPFGVDRDTIEKHRQLRSFRVFESLETVLREAYKKSKRLVRVRVESIGANSLAEAAEKHQSYADTIDSMEKEYGVISDEEKETLKVWHRNSFIHFSFQRESQGEQYQCHVTAYASPRDVERNQAFFMSYDTLKYFYESGWYIADKMEDYGLIAVWNLLFYGSSTAAIPMGTQMETN